LEKQILDAHIVAKNAQQEMQSRLSMVFIKPKRILCMGFAVAGATESLKELYPNAEIVIKDYSEDLYNSTNAGCEWGYSSGDLKDYEANSFDIVIGNLFFPWVLDKKALFAEWTRTLTKEGLLMFSSLGPDTLKEIKDNIDFAPEFEDMHDIGDALQYLKFQDPVMDVDRVAIKYKTLVTMQNDLQFTGFKPCDFSNVADLSVSYEIIYAHARNSAVSLEENENIVKISLSEMREQLLK